MAATDYATKWVKARGLRCNFTVEIVKFLYETNQSRDAIRLSLTTHKPSRKTLHQQYDTKVFLLTKHFLLLYTTSTTYYFQGNGQAVSTNKVIVPMLHK